MDSNFELLLEGLAEKMKTETAQLGREQNLADSVALLNTEIQNSDLKRSGDYLEAVKLITDIVNASPEITLAELEAKLSEME